MNEGWDAGDVDQGWDAGGRVPWVLGAGTGFGPGVHAVLGRVWTLALGKG